MILRPCSGLRGAAALLSALILLGPLMAGTTVAAAGRNGEMVTASESDDGANWV